MTEERKQLQSKIMKKLWETKRDILIEKQKKLGYRTYGTGLFYKTNKTRYGKSV